MFESDMMKLDALLLFMVAFCLLIVIRHSSGCYPNMGMCDRQDPKPKEACIGIDIGTMKSRVSVMNEGRLEILEVEHGKEYMHSYVGFTKDGDQLIGSTAKDLMIKHPENVVSVSDLNMIIEVYNINLPSQSIDLQEYPFKLIIDEDDKPVIEISTPNGTTLYAPHEIYAMLIAKLKGIAEVHLRKDVYYVVMSIPAHFDDNGSSILKNAASKAGLENIRLVNEPILAAAACGIDKMFHTEETIVLVIDIRDDVLKLAVVVVDDGVFEVLFTYKESMFVEKVNRQLKDLLCDIDLQHTIRTFYTVSQRNKDISFFILDAIGPRILMSTTENNFTYQSDGSCNDINFTKLLRGYRYELLYNGVMEYITSRIKVGLDEAGLSKEEVNEVILVGPVTHLPVSSHTVETFFSNTHLNVTFVKDTIFAFGAAVYGYENQNEDEIILFDFTPLSIGVETAGGFMTPIIQKYHSIPVKVSRNFTSTNDYQTTVTINIYEGERPLAEQNHLLGNFTLTGIISALRGVAQIEVTFEIDVNGVLHVTAEDKDTSSKACYSLTHNYIHSEIIDRIHHEAFQHIEDDYIIRERLNTMKTLESYIYSLRALTANGKILYSKLDPLREALINIYVKKYLKWLSANINSSTETFDQQKDILAGFIRSLALGHLYNDIGIHVRFGLEEFRYR